jgi:hypothetical protein
MRKPLDLHNDIRIASPCPAEWGDMTGDDRVRHCGICQNNVYNLSALPAVEAAALLEERSHAICVRLYRRADGTVLTEDCPVGFAAHVRRRVRRAAMLAASWLGFSALVGCGDGASTRTTTGVPVPQSGSTQPPSETHVMGEVQQGMVPVSK